MRVCVILLVVFGALAALITFPTPTEAARLMLNPASGVFTVGSTFDISILVDTEGETINALDIVILFPPDKLQLSSPSLGQSIVGIWTSPPSFDNQRGIVRLRGGIPNGINVSKGLVTTLTFRARQLGNVAIKFGDETKVLLHDGKGTDALKEAQSGVYQIVLPPPTGPVVASETHPDQTKWYNNPNVVLRWQLENVDGYSYILDGQPFTIPDDISEGKRNGVTYRNLADGTYYFHIKALRDGAWGGVTHFAINIDTTPPAEFPIEILPQAKTTRRQPIIKFSTTDLHSGIDHYEVKIVPLSGVVVPEQPFFIEAVSPYIPPELAIGSYDVIVRAYDKAGNYREVTERLKIISTIFRIIGEQGIEIRGIVVLPWLWVWLVTASIVALLGYLAWYIRKLHAAVHFQRASKELPPHLKEQLAELKKYRERYGKLLIIILLASTFIFGGGRFVFSQDAQLEVGPPIITSASRDITNTEIFYIGGKTETANTQVILYLQNLQTGETQRFEVMSDKRGDWFYRHNSFLTSGDYLIWAQSKIGEVLSPPTPQIRMTVRQAALQIGASRISFELLNLILLVLMSLLTIGLMVYIGFHTYHARIKYRHLMKEIKEAEESIKRGFAVLRRDIEAELALLKKVRLSRELAEEERIREKQLLEDLEKVERYIGKEVWEVEEAGRELNE
jgi:hypothetical protein